ncbi:hypothetical protein CEXT_604061 [Caerostris extrusa]|uniref:Uncharacterized protein n=1 Tax=Caerostris extrusa TaxID=172846 RepID=A0AAV4SUQ6_CAEEX|nr:hypothetical protein CEXT_604061 [Caerostris extrusa]
MNFSELTLNPNGGGRAARLHPEQLPGRGGPPRQVRQHPGDGQGPEGPLRPARGRALRTRGHHHHPSSRPTPLLCTSRTTLVGRPSLRNGHDKSGQNCQSSHHSWSLEDNQRRENALPQLLLHLQRRDPETARGGISARPEQPLLTATASCHVLLTLYLLWNFYILIHCSFCTVSLVLLMPVTMDHNRVVPLST